MTSRKAIITAVSAVLLIVAAGGGYYTYKKFGSRAKEQQTAETQQPGLQQNGEDVAVFRIFYPVDDHLQQVERKIPRRLRQTASAEALLDEYFKGPGNGHSSVVPQSVRVLGIYRDTGQTYYIDLSDELRRNFQGDARGEFLLLKGIYDTLAANLQEFKDVKILVEGKEIESLGGHFFLRFPLKSLVSYDVRPPAEKKE